MELIPQHGPPSYVPRIYGFRIFGKRGSKYEKNQKEDEREKSLHDSSAERKVINTHTHTKIIKK